MGKPVFVSISKDVVKVCKQKDFLKQLDHFQTWVKEMINEGKWIDCKHSLLNEKSQLIIRTKQVVWEDYAFVEVVLDES